MFSKRNISLILFYNYGIKHYTINGERIAGLNFHIFTVFRSTVKVFQEYKCLSLIALHNEHLWARQRKSISVKTLMELKLQIFSPVITFPTHGILNRAVVTIATS